MNNQSDILYLEEINCKVDDALEKADADVRHLDENYMEFKRYMVQNRGEIDPHEMFQNEMELNRMDNATAFSASIRYKLLKLKDSPYFARIDFKENNSFISEKYYIGRFSFRYGNELLIFDWRAPISSMFYDYEIGPAGFNAPSGRIDGQLTEKRQFKIKNGKLEYAIQSSLTIQDNILQQELSHTSDEKMKSIITTIQKEQNQIIRNENSRTLIIQGVAGSGKTSIALHRIAFLLYRFKDRLSAEHIAILSPNRVFGNYISEVLPELGEEPVCELGFADIAREQIGNLIGFEVDRDSSESNDSAWRERVRFKSALSFVKQMDDFITAAPEIIFEPADYTYGRFTADTNTIKKHFEAYGKFPVRQRLKMIASDICDRFHSDNYMGDDIPRSSTILKALNKMLKVKNTLSLYKEFYKNMNKTELFIMPSKNTIEWADVFPFLYLYNFYEGLQENRLIRHLVIDEMQDYTPIQYAVINLLFHCPKTILGDFGQFINPCHVHTIEDLKSLYDGSDFIELTKSYRSTYEIISFAKQIKNTGTIEAIERHGAPPVLIRCRNKKDELLNIRNGIEAFLQSSYLSLAIITKTSHDAKQLYDHLSGDYEVHFISTDSTEFKSGITVTSIQMSKGLEFDEVIIPYADSVCYSSEHDRNLLYIACTRAMHRLTLFYTDKISPLLSQNRSDKL